MNKKTLCYMLEVKYLEMFGRKISYEIGNDNSDLYPNGWSLNKNYEAKIEILKEALEKQITIENTDLYQNSIEGVRISL